MLVVESGTSAAFNSLQHAWVLGTVVGYDQKTKTYTCVATDPEPIRQEKVRPDDVFVPRADTLEEDVNDLLKLTELHESTILFALKRRYMRDVVYTNIGPIVIALNPFTFDIPWYKDAAMESYLSEGVLIEKNFPHSWAVAHETYWEMRENSMNQTILISGESGAGKTEGAKIVVKYLGALSTRNGTAEQQAVCNSVNRKVIAASPILESFGNAKTIRNDNSSRFGKFMKIQFDRDGFLVGSFAIKYLLEKSRIISAAKDERVYHSFYQLACGCDMKEFGIRSTRLHRMLLSSECLTIAGVDDGADYAGCKQAMTDVGITNDEQRQIWSIVAGILFFQNMEFAERDDRGGMAAQIDEGFRGALTRAAELWGVEEKGLEKELTTTTRVARGDVVVGNLDKAKALDTRDSVSKGIYDWLFDWLVRKINETTDISASGNCQHWIGLLDIFGFEDFIVNSFEQLCINLANESLQNHYNHFIFSEDLRECREEGLDVGEFRQFADNKPCIELLSAKGGLFSLLDEECLVSGSEKNFMQKILGAYQTTKDKLGHPFFLAVTGKNKDNCFKIKHYAGDVTYTVDGFLDKNRDTLKDAMKNLLSRSTNSLVALITPAIEDAARPAAKMTVSGFFIRQLLELMVLINSTNPHWIRCIKPHPAKKPRMFSHLQVTQQLRSAGVLDTVRVRQGGYPIRFTKEVFVMRYKVLIFKEDGDSAAQVAASVFQRLDISKQMGQLGKTKVFLRHSGFTILNRAKDAATKHFAVLFQSIARACEVRASLFSRYVQMHKARLVAERKAKEEAARRLKEEEDRRRLAELEERVKREQAERAKTLRAAITLQRYVRGHLCRKLVVRYFIESLRARVEVSDACFHAVLRQRADDAERVFHALEKREADKHRMKSVDRRQTESSHTPGFKSVDFAANDHRSAELSKRREEVKKRVAEEAHVRAAKLEQQVKSERDRQRAATEEKRKLAELVELKSQEERRKVAKSTRDKADAEMIAKVQREADLKADEERKRSLRLTISSTTSVRSRHSSREFELCKADFSAREEWAAVRDQVLSADAQFRREQERRIAARVAMHVAGVRPTSPCKDTVTDLLIDSIDGRRTSRLTAYQMELERCHQLELFRTQQAKGWQ